MEKKICNSCNLELEIEQFSFRNKKTGSRQYSCKECSKLKSKDHYEANSLKYLASSKERRRDYTEVNRRLTWSYLLNHPCVDCGEKDPVVLEFDHQDDKSYTIASLVFNAPWRTVEKEIAKCEVRCANCHRRRTAKQQGWYKKYNLEQYD